MVSRIIARWMMRGTSPESMQFRQLRYFVKIVEAGSFSRAASIVHVAQPALSQQIAELEARLGVTLLQRSARGVRPTAAGDVLYKEASAILRQLDQLPGLVQSNGGEVVGSVNLGIAASLAPKLVGGIVEECRATLPKVRIRVSDGDSLFLEQRTSSAALDLAILYEDGLTAPLTRAPLFTQKLFLISREPLPDNPRVISLERLARLPLVLPAPTNGRRDLLDRMFTQANQTMNLALEADSLGTEMSAVQNKVGHTVLPIGDISHFGPHTFARPVPIDPPILLTCSIVHSGDLPLTRAAEAVRDCLISFIERRVGEADMPGLEWIASG